MGVSRERERGGYLLVSSSVLREYTPAEMEGDAGVHVKDVYLQVGVLKDLHSFHNGQARRCRKKAGCYPPLQWQLRLSVEVLPFTLHDCCSTFACF